jgi:hypothetical protein
VSSSGSSTYVWLQPASCIRSRASLLVKRVQRNTGIIRSEAPGAWRSEASRGEHVIDDVLMGTAIARQ